MPRAGTARRNRHVGARGLQAAGHRRVDASPEYAEMLARALTDGVQHSAEVRSRSLAGGPHSTERGRGGTRGEGRERAPGLPPDSPSPPFPIPIRCSSGRAQSRCRCGGVSPVQVQTCPGAHVAPASPVPVQMWSARWVVWWGLPASSKESTCGRAHRAAAPPCTRRRLGRPPGAGK